MPDRDFGIVAGGGKPGRLDQGRLIVGIPREHLLQDLRRGLVMPFENIEPGQIYACRTKTGVFRKDGIQ